MTSYEALRRTRPDLFASPPGGFEILLDPADVEAARRAVGGPDGGVGEPVGVVYSDRFITVVRDAVRFPDGRLGLHVRILPTSGTPGVVVLPLLGPAPELVLIEHYRHPTRSWHVEAPRGFGEPDAEATASAVRELGEELGTAPDELVHLGALHPDSGLLSSRVELYAARISAIGDLGAEEGIRRTRVVSVAEAEDLIREGELTDGFTLAVYTRARLAGLLDGRHAE
ncbi:NUDIX hydrolase [Streptomyces sp. NPDC054784]